MLHNQRGGELTTLNTQGRIRTKDTIPPDHPGSRARPQREDPHRGPAPIDATLVDFVQIWGEPLIATNAVGFTTQPLTVYIVEDDGTVTQ